MFVAFSSALIAFCANEICLILSLSALFLSTRTPTPDVTFIPTPAPINGAAAPKVANVSIPPTTVVTLPTIPARYAVAFA